MLMLRLVIAVSAAVAFWPCGARAQSVANPLTYEECMSRKKSLMDEAKGQTSQALETTMHWVGKWVDLRASVQPLYDRAKELQATAYAMTCVFHPAPSTAENGGERLRQVDGVADILHQAATSRESLSVASYARDKVGDLLADKLKDPSSTGAESPLAALAGFPGQLEAKGVADIVKDRLDELGDHNQATLGVLDRTAQQIGEVGRVDREAATAPLVIDYSAIFATDYAKAEDDRAAQAAADEEKAREAEAARKAEAAREAEAARLAEAARRAQAARQVPYTESRTSYRSSPGCSCNASMYYCCSGGKAYACQGFYGGFTSVVSASNFQYCANR